jgi:hypothetical protein
MSPIWLPLVGNSDDHPDRASNRRFLGKSLSVHWLAVSRRTPSAPGSKLFQEGDQGLGGYPSQPADLDGLNSARADKAYMTVRPTPRRSAAYSTVSTKGSGAASESDLAGKSWLRSSPVIIKQSSR